MSKDPPSKNYAQNPDMNIGLFQALFQPVGLKSRKPRRLRWDWHLRNFLISLIPPGVLWVFLVVVDKTLDPHDNALENTFQGSDEMRDVLKGGIGAFNNARRNETSDAHRGKRSHNEHKPGNLQAYFEQRLEKIEAQLIAMRAERERQIVSDSIVGDRMARVEKARGITKNIVRRPKEAS